MAQLLETVPCTDTWHRLSNYLFWSLSLLFFSQGKLCHGYLRDQKEGTKDAGITQIDAVHIMSGKMEIPSVQIADFDPWLSLQKVLTPLYPQAITKVAVQNELNFEKGRIY